MREALTEQEIDTMTANVRTVFKTEWDFINNPEHIELAFSTFQALLAYVCVEKRYYSGDSEDIKDRLKAKKSVLLYIRYNRNPLKNPIVHKEHVSLERLNEGMLLCLNELANYYNA